VHRLVIVDVDNKVNGIISLSDILTFIVLKQEEAPQTQENKTASLTTAFGLTRLSSSSEHVMLSDNHSSQAKVPGSVSNHSINSNSTSGNVVPIHDYSSQKISPKSSIKINQPSAGTIDQAIFEDDPMET
jgi:hypothetical protein